MSPAFFRGCLALIALARVSSAQCGEWNPGFIFPGVSGSVYAFQEFDDGSGPKLYVAGTFKGVGGIVASNIVAWDGTSWSALGSGIVGSPPPAVVNALCVFDDGSGPALFASGRFATAGGASARNIAKWNGASWSPVGSGLGGAFDIVSALCVFDDGSGPALYAGGHFLTAGSTSAKNIAKWDGTNWSALGSGVSTSVNALRVFDDGSGSALYVGGVFSTAGGMNARNIAKWNGAGWAALGHGLGGPAEVVNALRVFDDGSGPALYAGGRFVTAGGGIANHVARWNGSSWTALDSGTNSEVTALEVFDDGSGLALYAGGDFTSAGGAVANGIARWNGTAWSTLGSGMGGSTIYPVLALVTHDDGSGPKLFAGGTFTLADDRVAFGVAKWDGASWARLSAGNGIGGAEAFQVFDDGTGPALYAGGDFVTAGIVVASRVAKWNGSSWAKVGSGVDANVLALQAFDDGSGSALYAGGDFINAGDVRTNHVAKWDGTSWSALGSGMDSYVASLCMFDDGSGPALYAGGGFVTAGGISANRIAKWNGTSWSALGTGVDGGYLAAPGVFALEVFDDGSGPALYAGGNFIVAGGTTVNHVAKWNGTSWSALGTGMNSHVHVLRVFDDGSGAALYASGSFTTAGGAIVNGIAKWNGTSWSKVGGGFASGGALALYVFDDGSGPALFAGGPFTLPGSTSTSLLGKWNGVSWSTIAGGENDIVFAFQAFDDGVDASADLFVGGSFWQAAGLVSSGIAELHGCATTSFCSGDGSIFACPCANDGAAGHGCDNSSSTGGALLSVSGVASLATDSVLFHAAGEKPNALSILAQGSLQSAALPFGQGLRCVAGSLKRLYAEHAANGAFSAPTGAEPSVHTRSASLGDVIPAGSSRYYFAYYRDATVLGGCSSADTFNASQAMRLIWSP